MRLVVGLMVGLLAVSCGSDEATSDSNAAYLFCEGARGSWTDLDQRARDAREASDAVAWTDEQGCAINLEFVFHTFGDEHCGWEDAEFVSLGLPAGTPFTGPEADPPGQDWMPMFFFNEGGVIDWMPAGETRSVDAIPGAAVDLGLRVLPNRQLWLSADEQTMYLLEGDAAREFVRLTPEEEIACA